MNEPVPAKGETVVIIKGDSGQMGAEEYDHILVKVLSGELKTEPVPVVQAQIPSGSTHGSSDKKDNNGDVKRK